MNYPKSVLRKIISVTGYSISKKSLKKDPVLANIFKTSYNKTALLSYIRVVFDDPENAINPRHTNRLTCRIMAEILSEMGYNVDVINYDEEPHRDFDKYDLVIGLGKTLDYFLGSREIFPKTKVIWFGTGCNPLFSNVATINRVADFYKRHNKLILSSSRYIKEDWVLQHEFADWIILHGSKFARSTYRDYNISSINAPVYIKHAITRTDEDWAEAKKNYLWFGTNGAIHKGLDLVIDAFSKLKDCNLHICGGIESESEFFNYYRTTLSNNKNIIYHGFIDISSPAFKSILHKCAFVIYPSASEGNSPSVITCMANGGLMPVVSENADVDVKDYGISIKNLTVEAVINSIKQSQELAVAELKEKSDKILKETQRFNSFEYFRSDFKQKLTEALKAI